MGLITKMFGTRSQRELKKIQPIVDKILAKENEYAALSEDALKAKTGIALDKRKIVISDPIKTVGTYTVTCKLGYEISAPLTVKIEEA